ncbi:IF4E factor, partial [Polyodon spathula]|nr:IF4E factor [Polyodon spathula]
MHKVILLQYMNVWAKDLFIARQTFILEFLCSRSNLYNHEVQIIFDIDPRKFGTCTGKKGAKEESTRNRNRSHRFAGETREEPIAEQDGIEPMWEDRRNKCGGRWLITLSKQQRHTELDRFWLETLLCIIGETFDDYSDDVCGAVINVRAKGDKIAVWTTDTENREAVTYIGRRYKEGLGLPAKIVIGYQAHADTATKSTSLGKNKFVV